MPTQAHLTTSSKALENLNSANSSPPTADSAPRLPAPRLRKHTSTTFLPASTAVKKEEDDVDFKDSKSDQGTDFKKNPRVLPTNVTKPATEILLGSISSSAKSSNVYVSGLGIDTTNADLFNIGSRFGIVISHRVVMTAAGKTCRGYGFLTYPSIAEADTAIISLNAAGYTASHAQESLSSRLRKSADHQTSNVYLCNLPRSMTVQQLDQLFAPHSVGSRRILVDAEGQSRGVAFVRLAERYAAAECIERLNGITLPGETIAIQARFADNSDQKKIKSNFKIARGLTTVPPPNAFRSMAKLKSAQPPPLPIDNAAPAPSVPVLSAAVGPMMTYTGRAPHHGAFMILNQYHPGMYISSSNTLPATLPISPALSMPTLSPDSLKSSTFSSQASMSPDSFLHGSSFSPEAYDRKHGDDLDQAAQQLLSAARGESSGKDSEVPVGLGLSDLQNRSEVNTYQTSPLDFPYAIPAQAPQYLSWRRTTEQKPPVSHEIPVDMSLYEMAHDVKSKTTLPGPRST